MDLKDLLLMEDASTFAHEAFLVSFAHMGKVLVFTVESLMAEFTDRMDAALDIFSASFVS